MLFVGLKVGTQKNIVCLSQGNNAAKCYLLVSR